MAWGKRRAIRIDQPRERRARGHEAIRDTHGWFFACILTLVLLAGSVFMLWRAYDIACAGVPYTFPDKWRTGGGSTVSATHATVWHAVFGGVTLDIALGNLKFMLTGSARPFFGMFPGYYTRRGPRLRRVPDGKTCPYCGYSRVGMAWADLCPECGKNSGM